MRLASAGDPFFYMGLIYASFPVNALLYAWNDLGDGALDRTNPRKGPYLLGAVYANEEQVRQVFLAALGLNLGILLFFAVVCGPVLIGIWWAAACATNYTYNNYPRWREGPPPLDFVGPLGYILLIPFAAIVNGLEFPSLSTLLFHIFMVLRSQLWGQIIDLGPDARAQRQTTAVALGIRGARGLLVLLQLCELFVAIYGVQNTYVEAFSALSMATALLEFFVYPNRAPSLHEAALTGALMTPAAAVLLLHVLFTPAGESAPFT
ncbi:Hypothetical Protein FCC1311_077112 [Hondaea fermentalgiana]|uniref:Prenyltransferase n=1 Tax=Hondaea fermentalgiana TaxID=2315210 RepID=A0A2R5GKS8_9STRA|nr:Hypothetical Protein FCC1311_077112 [Hondaea fermentalgiana]|eukprot:GBG31487.1 Hypothetical Protein FCC1311_077112 [Hondaea fermentalgiana]